MLLKKYSTKWINDFSLIKGEIEKALGGLAFTIEHVGSTAIPNLDAKPSLILMSYTLSSQTLKKLKVGLKISDIIITEIRESKLGKCLKEKVFSQIIF